MKVNQAFIDYWHTQWICDRPPFRLGDEIVFRYMDNDHYVVWVKSMVFNLSLQPEVWKMLGGK